MNRIVTTLLVIVLSVFIFTNGYAQEFPTTLTGCDGLSYFWYNTTSNDSFSWSDGLYPIHYSNGEGVVPQEQDGQTEPGEEEMPVCIVEVSDGIPDISTLQWYFCLDPSVDTCIDRDRHGGPAVKYLPEEDVPNVSSLEQARVHYVLSQEGNDWSLTVESDRQAAQHAIWKLLGYEPPSCSALCLSLHDAAVSAFSEAPEEDLLDALIVYSEDSEERMGECQGLAVSDGTLAGILPVELTSFSAHVAGDNVILEWETASETNNAGFAIERRRDGFSFEEIAFVKGSGTVSEARSYRYVTDTPIGTYLYRLKQLDFDGVFEYSSVVEVTREVPNDFHLLGPYPNPFNPTTAVELSVAVDQQVSVTLHDVLGKEIKTLYTGVMSAHNAVSIRIDADDLPSGTYLVRVVGENFVTSRTVVLQK